MNIKIVVSAIMAMSLTTAGFAFAQRYGDADPMKRGATERAQRRAQMDRRDNEARRPNRHELRHRAHERRDERGAGPNLAFHRGERLPAEYRHRNYVVDDWRGHHLSPPPRGYHWVQTGGDYVLVAIATGIILELLLNN